jgi:hypothetical protein
MATIKLAKYAQNHGISYITAYRWFKEGKMPPGVYAYQTATGTILVDDNPVAVNNQLNANAAADLVKKAVEFGQNDGTVADFAAYVLSNYKLEINGNIEGGGRSNTLNCSVMNSTATLPDVPITTSNTITTNSVMTAANGMFFRTGFHRTYDEARKLTDLIVKAGLIPANDMIAIDRHAKEACSWTDELFDLNKQMVEEKLKGK